MEFKFFF